MEIDIKYKCLHMTDIDRLTFEIDKNNKNNIIMMIDIKYNYSKDIITFTKRIIYDTLQEKICPVYICYIDQDFKKFRVVNYKNNKEKIFTEIEYADWLLSKYIIDSKDSG